MIGVFLFFYAFVGGMAATMSTVLFDEVPRPRTVAAIGIFWPVALVLGALWLCWRAARALITNDWSA